MQRESDIVRLFASGGYKVSAFYNETLTLIQPLFDVPADADYKLLLAVKDNATCALGKMLQAGFPGLPLAPLVLV